jgi:hypothetical protein
VSAGVADVSMLPVTSSMRAAWSSTAVRAARANAKAIARNRFPGRGSELCFPLRVIEFPPDSTRLGVEAQHAAPPQEELDFRPRRADNVLNSGGVALTMSSGKGNRSERAVEQAQVVRQQLHDREARIQALRGHYAKFGERVMGIVLQAFNQDGGLRQLVHRVTGRVIPREDQQNDILAGFIQRHGEGVFVRQAIGLDLGTPTAGPLQEREEPSSLRTPTPSQAEKPAVRRFVRLPTGEMIEDRRKRPERRQKPDRRASVDLIYSNRRFGGDRRKGQRRGKAPRFADPPG